VIDGYVWLDGAGRAGLGAYLFEAMHGRAAVVGVAKNTFRRSTHAAAVVRSGSRRPLYVTARGLPLEEAAAAVRSMHGAHRIPTLLKLVDRLSRERTAGGS
jgi:deoxyribonuclease V